MAVFVVLVCFTSLRNFIPAASTVANGFKDEYYEKLNTVKLLVSWATGAPVGSSYTMGAWIPNAPWNPADIDTFDQMVGTNTGIVHWFQDWDTNPTFRPELFDAAYQRGAMPMVSWSSWNWQDGTNQPDYQLQDIIDGRYDTLIRNWARASAAYGKPYFLRFDHEFNGTWFPWSPGDNGNDGGPAEYVQAWRHVHDIFEQEGATNVRWVWCPNVDYKLDDLDEMYPGDAYVDWTCMDGYNWGSTRPSGWESFASIFRTTYDAIIAFAPRKPMMIGETASAETGGDKAAWIRQTYYADLATMPQLKAVVWFDEVKETDWRVNSSASSLKAYKEVAASPLYQGRLP